MKKRNLSYLFKILMLCVLNIAIILIFRTNVIRKSMIFTFEKSLDMTRSAIINIPNLGKVTSVTADTGEIEYIVDGNDISITCTNGRSVDYSTPSKYISQAKFITINEMPPDTITYTYGDYSGVLDFCDCHINSEVIGFNEVSKLFVCEYKNYRYVYYDENGNETSHDEFDKEFGPPLWQIEEEGYFGTLHRIRTTKEENVISRWPNGSKKTVYEVWTGIYSDTITKLDIVFEDTYTGYYRGFINGPTTYYYAYNVAIEYEIY